MARDALNNAYPDAHDRVIAAMHDLLTVKSVAAMTGRHIVELVTSPTHVVMSENVESVTSTGDVPAQQGEIRSAAAPLLT